MFKRIVFSLAIVVLCAAQANAGAWVQDEGHGLFIANATYFSDGHYYNTDGNLVKEPRYQKYEIQPYLEYGLLPNLTVGGTAFVQRDSQSGDTNYGVADPTVFFRSVIWKDEKQVVSLQPLVKFSSEFGVDTPPRGGSDSTDFELSALYGRNITFFSPRDYIDIRVGYRYRANSLNDQIQADAAMGLEIAPGWQLIPAIRTITSTGIKDNVTFSENGDQDYDLIKLELGTVYKFNSTESVGLTVFDHVSGQQTGNGAGVTLSFARQF